MLEKDSILVFASYGWQVKQTNQLIELSVTYTIAPGENSVSKVSCAGKTCPWANVHLDYGVPQ